MDEKRLEHLITLDEGERFYPYRDTVGKLTIGRGHNLTDLGIPEQVSQLLYDLDVARAKATLGQIFPEWRQLDEVRQAVFVDLAFNLDHKLSTFMNLLASARKGDWAGAAQSLQQSLWFPQVGKRGPRLVQMLQTGQWPVWV